MTYENLKSCTFFQIDYRSIPSGIGHINYESGDVVLVTEADSGPKDMESARKVIKEEYLPSSIDNIPLSMGAHWKAGQLALQAILKTHDVKYVIDSELSFEFQELVEDMEYHIFTLENWIIARGIDINT